MGSDTGYFGTDGIRGRTDQAVTTAFAESLGRAAALWTGASKVFVGRDTRASGADLQDAFARGVVSAGGDCFIGGVLPTPAVALAALDLGVVVTAGHNGPEFNGFKIFDSHGHKLTDDAQRRVEGLLDAPSGLDIGRIEQVDVATDSYLEHILERFGPDLTGVRIAVDCANGAYSELAPRAFARCGAEVHAVANEPDGNNINVGCGTSDMALLQEVVRAGGFDLGIAFDGDGDCVLAVDENGTLVDGDQIVAILALEHQVDRVAVTVMTNLGFHALMREHGIEVHTTDVGDRYVLEAMQREGAVLGGEQSGHIIWLRDHVTGDGLASALLLCGALRRRKLSDLAPVFASRQASLSVNIGAAWPLSTRARQGLTRLSESDLVDRLLVRTSGTEPVVRVLAESSDGSVASRVASEVADRVRDVLRVEIAAQVQFAGFSPDVVASRDMLGFQRDVDALASLVLAEEVRPPLSVGLFGDWGTGKSTFLELTRQRIASQSARMRLEGSRGFCSHVKQVTFNAWHYVDDNLWASLVTRIFEGIVEGEPDGDLLLAELATPRMLRDEATRKRDVVRSQLEEAHRSLAAAQEALEESRVAPEDYVAAFLQLDLGVGGPVERLVISRRRVVLAVAAFLATVAAIAVALSHWHSLASHLSVALASAAAFIASIFAIVRSPMRQAQKSFRSAAALRARAVEVDRERLQARKDGALARVNELESELAIAQDELRAVEAGEDLYRFARLRIDDGDYDRHLGLMALIREDFERMSGLLTGVEARRGVGLPAIDRVILYIDDLDRCPAGRVVEVLEAVHLLLAMPLFVVLVAVDPRWLREALTRHHDLFASQSGAVGSTPQDYLEKIFQIPIGVPEMPDDGYREIVRSMFPLASRSEAERTDAGNDRRRGTRANADGADDPTAATPGPITRGATDRQRLADDAPLDVEMLALERAEIEFMELLGPLIRSPRSAKRLGNTYRLLRASLSIEDLERLSRDEARNDDSRSAMLLLAVAAGHPNQAASLFRMLASTSRAAELTPTLSALLTELPPGHLHDALVRVLRGVPDLPLDVLCYWLARVTRYTFDGGSWRDGSDDVSSDRDSLAAAAS